MKKIKLLSILLACLLILGCALCGCEGGGPSEVESGDVNANPSQPDGDGEIDVRQPGTDEDVDLPPVISDIDTSYLYTDIEGRFMVTIPYVFSAYNESHKTLDSFYMESAEGDASVTIRVIDVMSIWDAKGDLKEKYPDGEFIEEIDAPEDYVFFREEVVNGTTTYAKVRLNEDGNKAFIVEMSYPDVDFELFADLIYEINIILPSESTVDGTADPPVGE